MFRKPKKWTSINYEAINKAEKYVVIKKMQTLAAVSLAGGQGKTTTCYFLAKMLAKAGQKVLAIDCDPQANLTFS